MLDYPAYFDLQGLPLPEDRAALLARLEEDRLLIRNAAANWDVTNLGAILFAKDLHRFRGLARKAMRVVDLQHVGTPAYYASCVKTSACRPSGATATP